MRHAGVGGVKLRGRARDVRGRHRCPAVPGGAHDPDRCHGPRSGPDEIGVELAGVRLADVEPRLRGPLIGGARHAGQPVIVIEVRQVVGPQHVAVERGRRRSVRRELVADIHPEQQQVPPVVQVGREPGLVRCGECRRGLGASEGGTREPDDDRVARHGLGGGTVSAGARSAGAHGVRGDVVEAEIPQGILVDGLVALAAVVVDEQDGGRRRCTGPGEPSVEDLATVGTARHALESEGVVEGPVGNRGIRIGAHGDGLCEPGEGGQDRRARRPEVHGGCPVVGEGREIVAVGGGSHGNDVVVAVVRGVVGGRVVVRPLVARRSHEQDACLVRPFDRGLERG